ncbi:MAG: hypothetical protein CYPHOPRED_003636 [Cyphobasidiales sp. Tagirdzhanova-0007]|nr:MAG: hypothetical protein CYPHOPRED_003636 [Cyphobasidiales sp. Tagirdzhanova-0007]
MSTDDEVLAAEHSTSDSGREDPAADTSNRNPSSQAAATYSQPVISFSQNPLQLAVAQAKDASLPSNFFRCAKWRAVKLACEDDRLVKIFALPPELLSYTTRHVWDPFLSLPSTPAALLGVEWYPFAASQRPETFCFVKSCRDLPVTLVDGNTGKIRASYAIIDHQERFIGPQSMAFSPDGMKLYCGFESAIECFDIAHAGNTGTRFKTSPSRKSRQGQKGLISCIALSPDQSGLMAAGSYGRSICLYDMSAGEPRLLRSLSAKEHKGAGVTQVKFHPTSPELLYTASRCSDSILLWDVRNTKTILMTHYRKGHTNQRIHFDIDVWGKWLTTGDTDGFVHFSDTQATDSLASAPIRSVKLAHDVISSASLHPLQPCLLTTSGSRHLKAMSSGSEAGSASESGSSAASGSSDAGVSSNEADSGSNDGIIAGAPSMYSVDNLTPRVSQEAKLSCLSVWGMSSL